jgi:hypothetical protein
LRQGPDTPYLALDSLNLMTLDDRLYAFSLLEDFAAFDGKEIEILYQAIESKLEEIVYIPKRPLVS